MTKLKTFAMTAVAAAAIGVGGLATAPSASAAPRYSCSHALTMAKYYMATGDVFFALGHVSMAASYYGRAEGVVEASC